MFAIMAFTIIMALVALTTTATAAPHTRCTVSGNTIVNCSTSERKLIVAAMTMSAATINATINASLKRLERGRKEVIKTLCGPRRGANCWDKAGRSKQILLTSVLVDLQAIKACRGVKPLKKKITCLIDQDNKILVPIINNALAELELYNRGQNFLNLITFKGEKK